VDQPVCTSDSGRGSDATPAASVDHVDAAVIPGPGHINAEQFFDKFTGSETYGSYKTSIFVLRLLIV